MFRKEYVYSLQIAYVLSVIFGTWPLFPTDVYTTNNSNYNLTRTVKTWFKRYFVCTLWLMITVSGHIYYVTEQFTRNDEPNAVAKLSKYDAIVKKLLVAENWTFNLTAIINIVMVYFTSKYIPGIFYVFQETEQWLESVMGSYNMKKITRIRKLQFYKSIFWLISVYTIICVTMVVEYSGLLSIHRDAHFLNIIFQDLGKLSMMTFDLQFANLCAILQNRFRSINRILRDIKKTHEMKEKSGGKFASKCLQLQLTTSSNINRDLFDANDERRRPEIFELNVNHRLLYDAINKMNRTYQIQITLNIAVCFFNTVCVLFTTISEYRANTDWTLWISGVLWVTYYVLRMIMVCASASAVIEQAYKPKTYLSCINDRNLDEKQKYQISQFSRRLANTDIKFTFCGLITVNTSLLSSAVVGVITYLVIALQYSYS